MKPPAQTFAGVFTDFKLVKTRNVAQVIVEVPIEAADQALATLGGLPRADQSPWVAVARLNCTSVNPPQEAGACRKAIAENKALADGQPNPHALPGAFAVAYLCRCTTILRRSGLEAARKHDGALASELAAEVVRLWCRVESRAAITPGSEPAERWHSLDMSSSEPYEQWLHGGPNAA
jgi:hypothetical protein